MTKVKIWATLQGFIQDFTVERVVQVKGHVSLEVCKYPTNSEHLGIMKAT